MIELTLSNRFEGAEVDPELEDFEDNPQTINVQKAKKSKFHKRGERLAVNQTTDETCNWTINAEAKVKINSQNGNKKQKQKTDFYWRN